jgi:hypothetical protein
VKIDALVHTVVLERADQLEPGAVSDVRQARVTMAAEVALVDQTIGGAVEHGAPILQLTHARWRLLGVELRHAPDVEELAAAHGVSEMDFPAVFGADVCESRCHAALGHDGVGLTQEALRDHPGAQTLRAAFDRRSQPCAACTDDEHLMFDGLNLGDVHAIPFQMAEKVLLGRERRRGY